MLDYNTITERFEKLKAERRLLMEAILHTHVNDDAEVIAGFVKRLRICDNRLCRTEKRIRFVLKRISDPRLCNILEAKIFLELTWEKVAEHVYCDVRTVYRLKKKAEDEFTRILRRDRKDVCR